jgi:hypothetical protein
VRRVTVIVVAVVLGLGSIAGVVVAFDYLADVFAGTGSRSRACDAIYREDILAVPGVTSVEVHCAMQLGGTQTVEVSVDASDNWAAQDIARDVVTAMARDPRVEDGWLFPRKYRLDDGSPVVFNFYDEGLTLGTVGDVRRTWSITPTPERKR